MSINPSIAARKSLLALTLGILTVANVYAQPSVMVAGDSISAGFNETSYRLPLLNSLNSYNCTVDMVGDQTLNTFDYRQPVTSSNGSNISPFTAANGYDLDHQAFPAIRAEQFAMGVSSAFYTVSPIATYVTQQQPDFVLVHLGSNDISDAFFFNQLNTDSQLNAWADTTMADVLLVVNNIIGAHSNPSSLRVLVANFIPYDRDNLSASQRVRAARASKVFTQRLDSMVLQRADSRVLIVDVETGFDPDSMTDDGLHPNDVGEQHMAGAFLPVLRGAGLCGNTPSIVAPAVGSTVIGDSALLQWTNNGLSVSSWRVRVGDTQTGESSTYFDSGNLPGSAQSVDLTGRLPANQTNVFVSLQYTSAAGTDLILSSFFNRADSGDEGLPTMKAPLPGSLLTSSAVNFSWESNDGDYEQWYVRIGSTPGQFTPLGDEYLDWRMSFDSARSVTVSGLPTDGRTIYLELSARKPSGMWDIQIFSYRAVGAGLPDKVLQRNSWYQVSLPYDPGSNNTVGDVFGDDLPVADYFPGSNGSYKWLIWAFDIDPAGQAGDNYRLMTVNDTVEVGKGYWILHFYPDAMTLSAPSGASANSNNVSSVHQSACENPSSCYAIPIDNAVASGRTHRYNILGYPLSNPTSALRFRVGTSSNIGCSGTRDCSQAEGFVEDLLRDELYGWNGDVGAYNVVGPLTGVMQPWDGFWAASYPAAAGQNAVLIMSEPGS